MVRNERVVWGSIMTRGGWYACGVFGGTPCGGWGYGCGVGGMWEMVIFARDKKL